MTWQTEFDEMYQHITNEKNRLIYKGYQYVTVHACIKAFIQDLLDRKAREIKKAKWRKTTKTMLISYYNGRMGFHTGDGKHQDHTIGTLEELQHSWYNQGVDDALSILKEE